MEKYKIGNKIQNNVKKIELQEQVEIIELETSHKTVNKSISFHSETLFQLIH